MKLNEKLQADVQKYLLENLFGMSVDDDVVFDEDGEEFYDNSDNFEHDLYTLGGIIRYSNYMAYQNGINDAQSKIREALGL